VANHDLSLNACIPKTKHDIYSVLRAQTLGFPAIRPILPELVQWTQDANWPVFPNVAKLLATAGPEIVPLIADVFESNDGTWKYFILERLYPLLAEDNVTALEPAIRRLAVSPTEQDRVEEVDSAAKAALQRISLQRRA